MPIAPMLEAVFGALPDGVVLSDGGRVLYMNPAAERLLGGAGGGEPARRICELLCARLATPGCSDCAAHCPLLDPADVRVAVTFEGEWSRAPSFRWDSKGMRRQQPRADLRVRCLRLPGTETPGREGFHLTLIEDAAAEAELARRQEDWRSMVVHDLRAPLANAYGAMRAAQDAPQSAELPLAIAVRNCRRVIDLLDTYLDLARFDAGAAAPASVAVRLDGVCRSVADELAYLLAERALSFELDVPAVAVALADAGLTERVVQNLLHNAVKFAPAGGAVRVSARREGERVLLTVANDGPPIAPEQAAALFERFSREGPRLPGQGAGLGLAFCREALRRMGGDIRLAREQPGVVFEAAFRGA